MSPQTDIFSFNREPISEAKLDLEIKGESKVRPEDVGGSELSFLHEDQTKQPPERFIQIRRLFTSLALSGRETSEGSGASYGKMLVTCFDLALLESYSEDRFYRFVYHDGVFEGLDNRRKVDLLQTVRSFCSRTGCQYILTVIDTDLPRDARDNKLLFSEEDIIRNLHDGGDDGRLFQMPAF